MKKKVLTILAVMLLISVLAVALVACSPDSYEKKLEDNNYKTEDYDEEDVEVQTINRILEVAGGYEGKVTWMVTGTKAEISISNLTAKAGHVTIIKFEKSADAKKYAEDFLKGEGDTVDVKGSIVIYGDADSVALVK